MTETHDRLRAASAFRAYPLPQPSRPFAAHAVVHGRAIEPQTCENCGCEARRRRFKRRACCGKCFYLLEVKRAVAAWDLLRPETIKVTPFPRAYLRMGRQTLEQLSAVDFGIFKHSYLGQVDDALRNLRLREMRRRGAETVSGRGLEEKFKSILRSMQLRDPYDRVVERFQGLALLLDRVFTSEQCRVLYSLLDDIEENCYDQVVGVDAALAAVRQRRGSSPDALAAEIPSLRLAPGKVEQANDLWTLDLRYRARVGQERMPVLLLIDAFTQDILSLSLPQDSTPEALQKLLVPVFTERGMPRRMTVYTPGSRVASITPLDVWLLERDIAVTHVGARSDRDDLSLDETMQNVRATLLRNQYATKLEAESAFCALSGAPAAVGNDPMDIVPFVYEPYDAVRRVQERGRIAFSGKIIRVPKAFRGKDVGLRPTPGGAVQVFFRSFPIARVHLETTRRREVASFGAPAGIESASNL